MPLKKSNGKTLEVIDVDEGNVIQTPDKQPMSLFDSAMLPAITLNVKQFAFPKMFLVRDAKRVAVFKKNPETGWDLKDENGNKTKTGEFEVRLELADAGLAQTIADRGQSLDGLKTIQCTVSQDIPLQKFEIDSTFVKLHGVNVMLGFGGRNVDRIVLRANSCELC